MDTTNNNETVEHVEGNLVVQDAPIVDSIHLEDNFPLHDRRAKGWKLIGFVDGAKPSRRKVLSGQYPYGAVPVWKFLGWDLGKKYDGEKIRELEKLHGVGKRKRQVNAVS